MSVDLKIATEISCCITAFCARACKISEAMIKQKLTYNIHKIYGGYEKRTAFRTWQSLDKTMLKVTSDKQQELKEIVGMNSVT